MDEEKSKFETLNMKLEHENDKLNLLNKSKTILPPKEWAIIVGLSILFERIKLYIKSL